MLFTIHIECDNDSFAEDKGEEVARILREVAMKIEDGYTTCYLNDSNGNSVGMAEFKYGE